jgi:hypothetical protein
MTTFDDRERGAEKKFEHDEELRFKISARRNKLLGLWAAEKLAIEGEAAAAYAKEVVLSDFEKPGDEDVLEKVQADFEAKGVALGSREIRVEMDRLWGEAQSQIMSQ